MADLSQDINDVRFGVQASNFVESIKTSAFNHSMLNNNNGRYVVEQDEAFDLPSTSSENTVIDVNEEVLNLE